MAGIEQCHIVERIEPQESASPSSDDCDKPLTAVTLPCVLYQPQQWRQRTSCGRNSTENDRPNFESHEVATAVFPVATSWLDPQSKPVLWTHVHSYMLSPLRGCNVVESSAEVDMPKPLNSAMSPGGSVISALRFGRIHAAEVV